MKKKWLILIGVAVLVAIFATSAFANNPIKLFVNDQEIKPDVSPQIVNGRTLVPVRWIAEALGADVYWDGPNNAVKINKPYFVSYHPEAEAKLYPFQKINGMYDGFILEVKKNRQYFAWKNVSNPSFAPQLIFSDINQDSEKELIIILTTGTGTGVHTEDIHVLNPKTFTEIDVENPVDIVKQISTKIKHDGDNTAIQIIIGHEETVIHKEKGYAVTWFDNVAFDNNRYQVLNNQLIVNIPAQVSPAGFIGEIQAAYVFDNGSFKAKTISFENQDKSDKAAVARIVENFGKKLQTVSLQAPKDIVNKSIQENYGDFISPVLLTEWQKDLRNVPGRAVSSPWPDRIEILSIEKLSESLYEIKGEIIEITSAEAVNNGVAAKRPITLIVEKAEKRWLITAVKLGAYAETNATVYKNTQYGFNFSLPESWRGYSVVTDKWEGFAPGSSVTLESGPLLSIRHPQWTVQNQRQDIPIMLFTLNQWNSLQNREFHIGAAPTGPKELARNNRYVFALPARYNYAFPTGYEEVENILNSNSLQANENYS